MDRLKKKVFSAYLHEETTTTRLNEEFQIISVINCFIFQFLFSEDYKNQTDELS